MIFLGRVNVFSDGFVEVKITQEGYDYCVEKFNAEWENDNLSEYYDSKEVFINRKLRNFDTDRFTVHRLTDLILFFGDFYLRNLYMPFDENTIVVR